MARVCQDDSYLFNNSDISLDNDRLLRSVVVFRDNSKKIKIKMSSFKIMRDNNKKIVSAHTLY